MSKSKSRRKPLSSRRPSGAVSCSSMFVVEGRVFSTRDAALAYCKAARISAYKVEMLDFDPVKLSVSDAWRLNVHFPGPDPVMLFSSPDGDLMSFTVKMSELVDLVSTVKARVRELARQGALL